MVTFTSSIRNWGTKECVKLVKPKLTNAMWGAGLSFHRCHAELSVPIDPYLDNVFDGEEGSRGIRLFTHGYDVYTPDKVLVTHDYHTHQGNPVVHTWGRGNNHLRHGAGEDEETLPTSWKWMGDIEKARDSWKTFGSRRVNMLLGIGSNFDSTEAQRTEVERIRQSRFGLGNKRSLEQVQEFTGINLLEEKMEKNGCGNLIWVPYEESPEYGLPQVLARGYDGSAVEATQEKNPAAVNPKKEANKQQVDPEDVDDQEKNPVAVDPEKEAKEQEGDIGHEKNPLVMDPEKEAEVQHREKEDAIDIESDLNDMDVPPPKTVLDPAEEAKKITKDPPVFKEPAKMDAIKKLSPPKTVLDSAEEAKNITKDPPVFKESAKMDAIKKLSPPVKPLDVAIPQSMKRAPSNVEVPQLRRVASSPQEGNDYYDYRKAGALMLLAFIFFKLVNHKKSKDDRKKN